MQFSGTVLSFSAERFLKTAGDLFFYEGNHEAALALVEKTLEIAPRAVRALVLRGDILFCLTRLEEALESFRQALKIDPECVEALISCAGVLEAMGHPREGLVCCDHAFTLITGARSYLLPELFDRNLSLLVQLKQYRQAQRLLKKAAARLSAREFQALQTIYLPKLQRLEERRRNVRRKAGQIGIRTLSRSMGPH